MTRDRRPPQLGLTLILAGGTMPIPGLTAGQPAARVKKCDLLS